MLAVVLMLVFVSATSWIWTIAGFLVRTLESVMTRASSLVEAGEVGLDLLGGLVAAVYGSLAALAGDDETAIRILEPLFARDVLDFPASRRALRCRNGHRAAGAPRPAMT